MPTIQDRHLFSREGSLLHKVLIEAAPRVMHDVVIPIASRIEPRYNSCQLRIYHVPVAQNSEDNELVCLESFGAEMDIRRLHKCTGFNFEKTQRLLRRRQDYLSWQSKDDGEDVPHAERKFPGAVRTEANFFGCIVGGCSGFNGPLDEFALQVLFVELQLLDITTLRKMIEISKNPYSQQYFTEWRML